MSVDSLEGAHTGRCGVEATPSHSHPEPEVLAAYGDGGLAGEDLQQVRDHLEDCRHCALLLEGYEVFDALKAEGARETRVEELKAARRRLEERLRLSRPVQLPRVAARRRSLTWAIAAGVALALVVATLWGLEQQRDARALGQSPPTFEGLDATAHVAVLDKPQALRSEGSERPEEVPIDAEGFIVVVPHAGSGAGPFRVEIRSEDGALLFQASARPSRSRGWIAFGVPGDRLGTGRYRVQLHAMEGGELAEYPFHLVRVDAP